MAANKLEIIAPPGKTTIETRRVIDAPRALVWDAFVKPEHLKHWMGPRELDMVTCEIDARAGGKWKMVYRKPGAPDFIFHGEFLAIEPPGRIERTFAMAGMDEHAAHETLWLEDLNGKTLIRTLTVHKTVEGRDGHLLHGMEAGMTEGYARLDELLASLR